MAEQQEQEDCGGDCLRRSRWVLGFVAFCTLLIVLACTSKDPVYSVTITGVAGLDDLRAAANNLPLSPVFNLTVRIDNTGERFLEVACIGSLSTVSVSYGDAIVAGPGSVPEFCAGEGQVRERRARAWGKGVDLPQFLRDQLAGELAAGEAAVDVKVTTPAAHYKDSGTVLVCSQAKIQGGPATCQKKSVYHDQQANPGSSG